MLGAFCLWGVMIALKWRNLPSEAAEFFDQSRANDAIPQTIEKEAFIDRYRRSEAPRADLYRCVTAIAALLLMPPLVAFFSGLFDHIWFWSGLAMGPYDFAQVLMDFLTLVFVMGLFVGGLYLIIRRYYARQPETLRQAIRHLESETQ